MQKINVTLEDGGKLFSNDEGENLMLTFNEEELTPVATPDFLQLLSQEIDKMRPQQPSPAGTGWQLAPQSKKEYISKIQDKEYIKALVAPNMFMNPNLCSFGSQGGILNGGVCWWHSRLQRAATYLTYYSPNLPPPTKSEAKSMVRRLINIEGVIEIPGFANFSAFSSAFQKQIQSVLETTQIIEGLFLFAWINGLAGASKLSPHKMKEHMDDIYKEVSDEGIAYVKLQAPGIDSHAWLVTEMSKDGGGYRYKVIDSMYPTNPLDLVYTQGDTGCLGCAPYLQRRWELREIKQVISDLVLNAHL